MIISIISIISYVGDKETGKTVTMNYKQYKNDISYSVGHGLKFKSLEAGDTLEIVDEIKYIESEYDDLNEERVTYIWFNSTHAVESIENWQEFNNWTKKNNSCNFDVTFEGDLDHLYDVGDKVVITLHIIEIKWYGYKIEYFKEIWDDSEVPLSQNLPEECIKLVEEI